MATCRLVSELVRHHVLWLAIATMLAASPAVATTIVDIATDAIDPFDLADTEPSIAVNPLDDRQIAIVSFSESWGPGVMAPVWKSDDGGRSWRKVQQIPQPDPGLAGPGDQKVAFDANGNLLVAELGIGSPTRNFIYRQTGGPDDPLTVGAAYGDDQPHLEIAVSAQSGPCQGRLYSPWLNTGISKSRSMDSNSTNSGASMATVGAGDNSDFPNRTTRIALAPDGKAFLIYKTREGQVPGGFENAHFRVIRSDDCGATWNAIGQPGVSVHGAGTVQTFFTTTFGNSAKGKVARARSSDAWIAVDPKSGNIYAAYVNRDSSGFGQILVARSQDQGLTWTSTRVTDETHHSAYPEIAVTENGVIGVLYIDFDDSGIRTIFRHRFARSRDTGATWTDEILQAMDPDPILNAASGFLWGDYEGLTAAGNTFYGVFTGQSINRTRIQLDPIFFRAEEEKHVRLLADINNDGRADIVGFGDAGVWTALATGDGGFEPAKFVLAGFGTAESWHPSKHVRLLADINNDGRADIVGFGDAGVWTALVDGI
jgi:hypothetical protein